MGGEKFNFCEENKMIPIGCIRNDIFSAVECKKCQSQPYNSFYCRKNRINENAVLIFEGE